MVFLTNQNSALNLQTLGAGGKKVLCRIDDVLRIGDFDDKMQLKSPTKESWLNWLASARMLHNVINFYMLLACSASIFYSALTFYFQVNWKLGTEHTRSKKSVEMAKWNPGAKRPRKAEGVRKKIHWIWVHILEMAQ